MTELRVTVPDDIAERLEARAQAQHISAEELASEAVRSYVGPAPTDTRERLGFIAIGRSGRSDIAERSEEILNEHFGR